METITGRLEQALMLLAVVEAGGFTAAATRLGVSKGFVSKQVAALEAAMGVRLLQRTTRRVAATEAGAMYLDFVRQARDSLGDGERAVSSVRTEVDGRLRITAPTSFGDGLLIELLGAFLRLHPQVSFDVDLSTGTRDLIGDGYYFALRQTRTLDPSLIARPLGAMRERIVAHPSLVAAHYPDGLNDPAQLSSVSVLRNNHFRDEGAWVLEHGGIQVRVPITGGLAINSYVGVRSAAVHGLGVARLPYYLVADQLRDGSLQELLPNCRLPSVPLSLVYPSREYMPHRSRVFRDFVVAWFSQPENAARLG